MAVDSHSKPKFSKESKEPFRCGVHVLKLMWQDPSRADFPDESLISTDMIPRELFNEMLRIYKQQTQITIYE